MSSRAHRKLIFRKTLAGVLALTLMNSDLLRLAAAENRGTPAEQLLGLQRPLVIAHRGFSAIAPENTLPAFKLAKAAGADLVELDYHPTSDGQLLVIHDAEFDRTTDATNRWAARKIRVDSRTAAEAQTLDAGKWFDPQFAGTKLPLLTEALEVIQAKGGVTLIERKAGEAAACAKLLREKGLINQVVVQAFDWKYLKDLHTEIPGQILGALGPPGTKDGKKLTDAEKTLDAGFIAEAKAAGARVIGWNKSVTREAIELAHREGIKVWIYTINDASVADTLLDMGVDGIITDNPAIIWRTLALRSFPNRP